MTPEQLLQDTAYKMSTAATGYTGIIRVCFLNGKIQCLNDLDQRYPEIVVGTYRADVITLGLNAKQWRDLKEKLLNVWRAKKS